jgi:hypothetical protein
MRGRGLMVMGALDGALLTAGPASAATRIGVARAG